MHDTYVAHKDDEHDYIENEFGCHGPGIDFDLTYAHVNSVKINFYGKYRISHLALPPMHSHVHVFSTYAIRRIGSHD
jgi:hypothetical protein